MSLTKAIISTMTASFFTSAVVLVAMTAQAQDSKVAAAMELLKSKTSELGPPKIDGTDVVGGKEVPAIYFGSTKMNNNFALVDDVAKQAGGTATIFVKSGDEYVRVATTVKKDDGERAIGTILDPKGKVITFIQKDEAYYGEADILGKHYVTGYDPIRDADNQVIGIYYVGYLK
ncbi:Cache 3/Cache 2 fusion domain-containing protein [Mesorhizobium sp. ANAO-SY3R2]|uniref:Cache 3/Cache 2 fusion domain-containing protein n=1 Tax=Mesorhizobium sp. ANAO-SY3R2 TaxID=3166644 RepID=UPI00366CD5C7